ncbi:MAG: hypothetical protein NUW01_04925 [Gemmatimonadaceae bacterium]|nr:hypothetical protein [Gemmatimonadaceae bacterium]
MSRLVIESAQFPDAFEGAVRIGQIVRLSVAGVVTEVSAETLDITSMGGPKEYRLGSRTTTILVTDVGSRNDDV